jgi:nickel/cobalt transporter (NiCoT) family protein
MATIELTAPQSRLRTLRRSFSPREWRKISAMMVTIVLLHVVGFGILIAFVVPGHYKSFGLGLGGLAYSLGLRHAFDADHISAIDNTTRKLLNERHGVEGKNRPLTLGYYFSLGHSTIVVAIGLGLVFAERAVFHAVSNQHSGLEQFGGVFGTVVSASFLFLIAFMNIVILAGIMRVFRSMRNGTYDEAELEAQLQNRGLMYRFFGKWMRSIDKEWKLYPVGVVFGMGFDTATEVALLASTAFLASEHLPWYSIMCLPVLFTAGMVLMDTIDCLFMNVAYGWAFFNPVRKIFYNLAITGLSVAICFFIGAVEVLGLLPQELHWKGSFWRLMSGFDINKAGMIIVGMFIVTWAGAVLIWRYGHIEEKWGSSLRKTETATLDAAEWSLGDDEPRGEMPGPVFGFAAD